MLQVCISEFTYLFIYLTTTKKQNKLVIQKIKTSN